MLLITYYFIKGKINAESYGFFLPNSFKAMIHEAMDVDQGFLNLSTIEHFGPDHSRGQGTLVLFTEECLAEHSGPWPLYASGITPCHKKNCDNQ